MMKINQAIVGALEGIRLADLCHPLPPAFVAFGSRGPAAPIAAPRRGPE